jgi:hypothetical protein
MARGGASQKRGCRPHAAAIFAQPEEVGDPRRSFKQIKETY